MKKTRLATYIVAIVIVTATIMAAQRGRGGAPAGRTSTIESIVVHGKSLEGNLEGDSADREVTVYLPLAYSADPARQFAVVYLLPDFGFREDAFTGRLVNITESADRLAAAAGFSAPIIVIPNALTLHGGSIYSNSLITGDWEKFVSEDLVAYIDGHYRTIPARISRGLAGHGVGGYGALRIGSKRPEVYSSLYVMSADLLDAGDNIRADNAAAAEAIKTRTQAEQAALTEVGRTTGHGPSLMLALAAAWALSPNSNNPNLMLELPFKDGKVLPEVASRWAGNAGLALVEKNASNLNKFYGIAIDVGTGDPLLASNRQLHQTMSRLKIAHYFEEYSGDHTNRIAERIERNLLPFFSKSLAAPANPTSPAVKD